jgi:hypothetical protein
VLATTSHDAMQHTAKTIPIVRNDLVTFCKWGSFDFPQQSPRARVRKSESMKTLL